METIKNPSNPNETITYNRIGGTPDNPIYFNDAIAPTNQPVNITPQSLTPSQQVSVPQVRQTSPTDVLTTVPARAQSDIEQARLEAERIQQATGGQAEQAQKTLLSSVRQLFGDRASAINQQATIEEQAGIGEQRKVLNEVNSQIAEQNIALRAEQERIRNAPMSASQKQVEINTIENDYGRRLADLAIRQSAARGNIEGIQQDAERKTKLLLAPIDNEIEYFKTFGQQNVDMLSKKEQQTLSLIVSNLESKKADIKELQKAKASLVSEIASNGGGSSQFISQINGAETLEDAYAIAAKSGYIGKLDRQIKQAQLNKIYSDIKKSVDTTGFRQLTGTELSRFNQTPQAKSLNDVIPYMTAVKRYKDAISNYGTGEVLSGKGRGELNQAYQELVARTKDFYKLGTYDNGVERLTELGIKKPSIFGRSSSRISSLDGAFNAALKEVDSNAKILESSVYGDSADAQQLIQTARGIVEVEKNDPLGLFFEETVEVTADPLQLGI